MTYYSREGRMGLFPTPRQQFGPPPMPRQRFGPPPRQRFGPPPMSRQRFGYPMQNYPQPEDSFYPANPFNQGQGQGQGQQQFNPFQQMQNPGNGGLSGNLNTIMGHVGTITNGINMMRQFGSIFSLFR